MLIRSTIFYCENFSIPSHEFIPIHIFPFTSSFLACDYSLGARRLGLASANFSSHDLIAAFRGPCGPYPPSFLSKMEGLTNVPYLSFRQSDKLYFALANHRLRCVTPFRDSRPRTPQIWQFMLGLSKSHFAIHLIKEAEKGSRRIAAHAMAR